MIRVNKFYYFVLIIIGFLFVERFCHYQTEGFQRAKIHSSLTPDPKWQTPALTFAKLQNIQKILAQPFYFLGSGGQCYAFVSEDDQYVIKFFKHHHMRKQKFYDHFPLPTFLDVKRKEMALQRTRELEKVFSSFKIAHDRFKKQTGLIYLHLNKSDLFHQKMIIVDKIGIRHFLDIDQMEFALQRKATLALPKIHALIQQQQIDEAKKCLNSCLHLIVERCKAGIADHDPVMKRNFGFIDDQAIEIDLGSFGEDDFLKVARNFKRELFFETIKLRKWIKKHSPQLASFLENQIADLLKNDS